MQKKIPDSVVTWSSSVLDTVKQYKQNNNNKHSSFKIKDDGKSTSTDPNAPTMIGNIDTFFGLHILVILIFKSTYWVFR